MSFLRTSAIRASALTRATRPSRFIRPAELQPWRRAVQRRAYASESGGHGAAKSSEVPWMLAAVAGTAGGLYLVMQQDLGGHDEDHHAEAHEPHGEDEGHGDDEDDTKNKSKSSSSEGDDSDESGEATPDKSDKPDPRGKPKSSNETSGKQEGLSNADTHHSSQIAKQDDKSKKGEGVAETAKLKGTVSTDRPGAENKEERGKAQKDKDA